MANKFKLANVRIKNVLGIEELELTPEGNVVEIKGHNGSGKTSTCEAIKDALGLSDYSSLLRDGEEKGEVVLDLGELIVKKTHKQNGETLTVKGRVGGTDAMSNISSPARVLKSLVNKNSVDPVRLLTAKPKDLLDAVLGALPMVVDADTIEELVEGIEGVPEVDTEKHALVAIAELVKAITEERRVINREVSSAKTSAEQLSATLPEVIETVEEIEAQIEENKKLSESVRNRVRLEKRKIEKSYDGQISELEEKVTSAEEAVEAAKLALLHARAELDNLVCRKGDEIEEAVEEIYKEADQLQDINQDLNNQLSQVNVHINTKRQVEQWLDKAKTLESSSELCSSALKGLQDYKEDLCKDLPITGLAISDGRLMMNGIPFETLNTAERIKLVVELAKLSAGDIGIVVIDNSEHLDKETYKQFLAEAKKTDLIFIVARVDDQDFEVK